MSQGLARALQILIKLEDGPANLDELTAESGVHKTTVLRVLRTLADERFVVRDNAYRFHLGSRLFELSSRALDQREVRQVAAPHLVAFNRTYGRTTHLAVLENDQAVYIDKLESHDHIRMYSRIGLHPPLHSSAVGKILLADLPQAERESAVSRIAMLPATPNTISTHGQLLEELEVVRRQGWAHDREENEASINCVAMAVRDASGHTVAAVSVSVPNVVLSYEELLELLPALSEVTAQISADLGWHANPNHEGTEHMTNKTVASTSSAPAPAHTFSQGIAKGGVLQVSGQGPMDPETSKYIHLGDVKGQTRRTLENVKAVLKAGDASVEDVVMFRVYLTTRDDFAAMNEAYGAFVEENITSGKLPSRTTVMVELPHADMLVEIDALAVLG